MVGLRKMIHIKNLKENWQLLLIAVLLALALWFYVTHAQ
jgi:YbbR domain-containing protein